MKYTALSIVWVSTIQSTQKLSKAINLSNNIKVCNKVVLEKETVGN